MPRDLPLGNGDYLVTFDSLYQLRDVYYPNVGQENHTVGEPCRFGVWADGKFVWISDPGWERRIMYEHETLVGDTHLQHQALGLRLHCRDAVDFDRTIYFETFPATDDNLHWALDMESDRMVNSRVDRADLDSEMTVVRNEFESGENDPEGVLDQRVLSTSFLWHNYGHDTIGARADIENVPIERLQAFWRTYYQPDNAVLLVAGKFDEGKTLALINATFSGIPRPARALQATTSAASPGRGSGAP